MINPVTAWFEIAEIPATSAYLILLNEHSKTHMVLVRFLRPIKVIMNRTRIHSRNAMHAAQQLLFLTQYGPKNHFAVLFLYFFLLATHDLHHHVET